MIRVRTCLMLSLLSAVIVIGEELDSVEILREFKLDTNDIAGWIPGYAVGPESVDQMYNLINGGAPHYIDNGCISFFEQSFQTESGNSARCLIMNFGLEETAASMFEKIKATIDEGVIDSVQGISRTAFYLDLSPLAGVSVLFYMKNLYVELWVSGYDNKQIAIPEARIFASVYAAIFHRMQTTFIKMTPGDISSKQRCAASVKQDVFGQQMHLNFTVNEPLAGTKPATIKIYSSNGQLIEKHLVKDVHKGENRIAIRSGVVIPGIYLVRVLAGQSSVSMSYRVVN